MKIKIDFQVYSEGIHYLGSVKFDYRYSCGTRWNPSDFMGNPIGSYPEIFRPGIVKIERDGVLFLSSNVRHKLWLKSILLLHKRVYIFIENFNSYSFSIDIL